MKEIIIAIIAIAVIAAGAYAGLDAMNWTAANKYSTESVRL